MESKSNQFDRLARLDGTRRSVGLALGTALFGLAEAATAKKKKKRCKLIRPDVNCDGTTCESFRTSTCRKKRIKRCQCRDGTTCLPNDSCGQSCSAAPCPAGSGCTCSTSGPKVCLAAFTTCEDVPTICATTADCPFRFSCDDTPCGERGGTEKRCLPLCGHAPLL